MNGLVVAVTGTPGTGKTLFAKRLAGRMRGAKLIEINDLVGKYKLYSKLDKFGTRIVDLGKLNKRLLLELKAAKNSNVLVVGHLAPELTFRCDIAVVTRCGLVELSKRLDTRKYHNEKATENIVAEAVDYCGLKMLGKCKNTFEVETDSEKNRMIDYITALSSGKKPKKPSSRQISKINDLLKLVKSGNKYRL